MSFRLQQPFRIPNKLLVQSSAPATITMSHKLSPNVGGVDDDPQEGGGEARVVDPL